MTFKIYPLRHGGFPAPCMHPNNDGTQCFGPLPTSCAGAVAGGGGGAPSCGPTMIATRHADRLPASTLAAMLTRD